MAGKKHPDTFEFSDIHKLKDLKDYQMESIKVYTDDSLVHGFEVIYKNKYKVGHHIGNHINADVKPHKFKFEEGEFMTKLIVKSGDLVDSISFETNQGRKFRAGG